MRKALLFLLFSAFAFGQNVSPYYPAKQPEAYRELETSQLTFYDTMFVQSVIPEFLSRAMGMTQIDSDLNPKTMVLKQIYQDQFSTGKLNFEFKTDVIKSEVETPEIVKSVKITGTPERVIRFFVRYWDTSLDFETVRADVERKHFQDIVKFYFNKGKPYILVTNSTFKSTKEFEDFFNNKLKLNANLQN